MTTKKLVPLNLVWCLLALMACAALAQDAGPRPGKYVIRSYGATTSPPLTLGSFELSADGTYKAYLPGNKTAGEGRYEYDSGKHLVVWKTGPYKDVWGGEFTIERDGKTHKIRMKRTTIATNSSDSSSSH